MKYQGSEKLDTFIGSAAKTAKIVKKNYLDKMRGKCIKFELATFINFEVIDNKSKKLYNIEEIGPLELPLMILKVKGNLFKITLTI
tara:strand:+ start:140 stop:397 length:258 start_codon:yes stop_codon:yes gene_type:complete